MKTFFLTALLLCLALVTGRAESPSSLLPGRYMLVFTDLSSIGVTPNDKEQASKSPKEMRWPSLLKMRGAEVLMETRAPGGAQIKMSGAIKGTNVYLWMSGQERDRIVTYHLTGQLIDEHSASGDLSIFTSHEKAAAGKWTLTKEPEPK